MNYYVKNVNTLAQRKLFLKKMWEESDPFVTYFMKTGPDEYHKIMTPAQHCYTL
jgi:hypothetical protein